MALALLSRSTQGLLPDDILGQAEFNSAPWSRTSKRGSGGAVLRRGAVVGRARSVFTWNLDIVSWSSWQTLAFVRVHLCVKMDLDPQDDSSPGSRLGFWEGCQS